MRIVVAAFAMSCVLAACGGTGGAPASSAAPPTFGDSAYTQEPATATNSPVPGGLDGLLVVGYQGWFGCPGDFGGNTAWTHWFNGAPSATSLVVDMLPDTSALDPKDLCDTGMKLPDGTALRLFSSQNRNVVDYHFRLMAQQQVGAAAVQRFVSEIENTATKPRRDNVLRNVMDSARAHGVPFFLSYDVSGAGASVAKDILDDWAYLQSSMGLAANPAYLHDHGKPVIELWGFGFTNHPGTAAEVEALLAALKSGAADRPAALVIGGVPSSWSLLSGDSQSDPAWAAVYAAYDVLSPWLVGRYLDIASAISYFRNITVADAQAAQAKGQRYLPVVFPGFSWHNLMANRGIAAPLDQIPRDCGTFFWQQVALVRAGNMSMAYSAMFDEFDEGSAMLPAVTLRTALPAGVEAVTLDEGGCSAPAYGYVRLLGQAAARFRDGTAAGPMPGW